jgi:hypothetical protein
LTDHARPTPPAQPLFVPGPPFPKPYGVTAAVALGLGLGAGFVAGLYALGGLAWGWPAASYAPLVQAHGQVQTLGLAGLLILGVGGILLPGFWRVKLTRPGAIPLGGGVAGLGLLMQVIGQPLAPSAVRTGLLLLAAVLPIVGFGWGGAALVWPRVRRASGPATGRPPAPGRATSRPAGQSAGSTAAPAAGATAAPAAGTTGGLAAWETLALLGALSLVAALVLRALVLVDLALSGLPASYGLDHQILVLLEIDGFLLAATTGIQLRLLPSLARTRPVTGRPEYLGIGLLALGLLARAAGLASTGVAPSLAALNDAGTWLIALAVVALFWATGLGRRGLPRTVLAPATLLPGRTRQVLRVTWGALIVGELGRALGLLGPDLATHAFTAAYLMPLVLVVGLRMLPRVSAYPVRFPKLCGTLIWAGVLGGLLRAFGELVAGPPGWQLAWLGGSLLTLALLVFAALVWSPWGVPTGAPRTPEVVAAYRAQTPRREG